MVTNNLRNQRYMQSVNWSELLRVCKYISIGKILHKLEILKMSMIPSMESVGYI